MLTRAYFNIVVILVLAVFSSSQSAWGETLTPWDNQELHHRARDEAQQRQNIQQKKDIFLQRGVTREKVVSLPKETPNFLIHTIVLDGQRTNSFSWLQPMLKRYTGQQIGKEGINLIVKQLTNELINRGYVTTRIVIPEQDIRSGKLRLLLIPGVISQIRFDKTGHSGSWHNAFPTKPGEILNLRDLEQGLEQLKRVPSQDADFKLVPGKQPGESEIVISMKENNNVRAVLSLDDSGNKATGKLQSSVTMAFDNPFGVNDLFNASLNKDGEQQGSIRGTHGYSFYYSFPSGYWTFTLSAQHNTYHQTIEYPNQMLPYSGDSDSREIKINKLLQRNQTSKTNMEFSIIKKQSRNFAADTEINIQHKDTTAAELALAHRQYFGKKILDVRLAYKRGVSWFDAQEPPISGFNAPTTHYNLWTLEANYSTPVTLGPIQGKYSSTIHIQNTKSILYAVDYLSIGNRYTIRGFDGEETIAAEQGYFIRNELSVPVGRQECYVGLDYGQVHGPGSAILPGKELAGAVIGFRGSITGVNYEIFSAWALKKPKELRTATPVIGFQLIYQI